MVDARNLLDPAQLRRIGFAVHGDRPPVSGRAWSVLGGAGFLGSHLCDQPSARGDEVVCVDDFSTGRRANVAQLAGIRASSWSRPTSRTRSRSTAPSTRRVQSGQPGVAPGLPGPAAPDPGVGSEGTRRGLELANATAPASCWRRPVRSTATPRCIPQSETYWGNVNPVGPRSVYDEAKRFAEALTMAHHRTHGTDVGIVRIFNTYGPRLRPGDGRVVSNFLIQAMRGEPLTVYGDGSQTRSLCFVDDEVRGLLALLDSDLTGPVNIGNPDEYTVLDLARTVVRADRFVVGHRSRAPSRPTTPPAVGPISPWPGRAGLGADHRPGGRLAPDRRRISAGDAGIAATRRSPIGEPTWEGDDGDAMTHVDEPGADRPEDIAVADVEP